MARTDFKTSTENRPQRVFATHVALAFVRRAVAAGLSKAEAEKRYLDFVNRPHAPRDRRAA